MPKATTTTAEFRAEATAAAYEETIAAFHSEKGRREHEETPC